MNTFIIQHKCNVGMYTITPGSGQQNAELQAKVEELIVQRKLNQYTHLTFGEEEEEDRGSNPSPSIVRPRSTSLQPGEVL